MPRDPKMAQLFERKIKLRVKGSVFFSHIRKKKLEPMKILNFALNIIINV